MHDSDLPAVFDGHNDTILDLFEDHPDRSFFVASDQGHIDLPRARQGNLAGGFFAMFAPGKRIKRRDAGADDEEEKETPLNPSVKRKKALKTIMRLAADMLRLEAEAAGQVKIVHTAQELQACLSDGTLAMIMHMEGAEAIDTGLDSLQVLYAAGLRSLGLVWSRKNKFGCGVPFAFPASPNIGPGLTKKGKRLVAACNELGIMIDLSHLNEKGFWDVAELSTAPLVATHSNAHALCPSPRNLTDRQLDAVAESNGVVGLNYHVGFLRADGRHKEPTTVAEIVRHAVYIADRIGVEHMALGSDFDGARMPDDLPDVSHLPHLMAALRNAGFEAPELEQIASQNWVRVLGQTWR